MPAAAEKREYIWVSRELAQALRELKVLKDADTLGELLDKFAASAIYRELKRAREKCRDYGDSGA